MEFETRAIHEGQEPDPATGALIVPIYQTSTFAQDEVGVHKGYDYARVANPTRPALQIADVYGGVYRMTSQVYEPKGYLFDYLPAREIDMNLAAHMDERTRMVWI